MCSHIKKELFVIMDIKINLFVNDDDKNVVFSEEFGSKDFFDEFKERIIVVFENDFQINSQNSHKNLLTSMIVGANHLDAKKHLPILKAAMYDRELYESKLFNENFLVNREITERKCSRILKKFTKFENKFKKRFRNSPDSIAAYKMVITALQCAVDHRTSLFIL